MDKEKLEKIIKKYNKLGNRYEPYDEEKGRYYNDVAEYIEDNLDKYLDEFYETEEDVISDVKEVFDASDYMLDIMFHRDEDFNDDDDGIGSFLSK